MITAQRRARDLPGSAFAGRHMRNEKFHAGPTFIVTAYSFLNAPWDAFDGLVDGLLASYGVPD